MDEEEDIDAEIGDTVIMDALKTAGVSLGAVQYFMNTISDEPTPSTFTEVYGRGGIFAGAEARRNLNLKGLRAMDLRAIKPSMPAT